MEDNRAVNLSIGTTHTITHLVAHICTDGGFLPALMKCVEAFPESQHSPTECLFYVEYLLHINFKIRR